MQQSTGDQDLHCIADTVMCEVKINISCTSGCAKHRMQQSTGDQALHCIADTVMCLVTINISFTSGSV